MKARCILLLLTTVLVLILLIIPTTWNSQSVEASNSINRLSLEEAVFHTVKNSNAIRDAKTEIAKKTVEKGEAIEAIKMEIETELQVLWAKIKYETLKARHDVTVAYLDVLLAKYAVERLQLYLSESEETLLKLRRQYNLGTGTLADVEYMEAELEGYESSFKKAVQELERSLEKLGKLTNIKININTVFDEYVVPEAKLSRKDLDNMIEHAIKHDFELYQATRERKKAQAEVLELKNNVDDEKNALFTAMNDRDQAIDRENAIKESLIQQVKDTYSILKQMEWAYDEAQKNLERSETDYQRSLRGNEMGLVPFQELYSEKLNYYKQQDSLFGMMIDYGKTIAMFNLYTSGYVDVVQGVFETTELFDGDSFIVNDLVDGLIEPAETLDELNNTLARLKAEQSEKIMAEKEHVDSLRKKLDQLQEDYYTAAEEGDLDGITRLKDELDKINELLEAAEITIAQRYSALLDKQDQLEDKLFQAEKDSERGELSDQINDTLVEMALLKPLLDEKSKNSLKLLDELQAELKEALKKNNLRLAGFVSGEFMELIEIIPETLFSEKQKEIQAEIVISELTKKAEQLEQSGNTDVAQSVVALADAVGERSKDKKDIQPAPPSYYINFVDFGIKVICPYLILDEDTYLPARTVFEALGATITLKNEQGRQRIIIQDPHRPLLLDYTVGHDIVYLNDRRIRLVRPIDNFKGVTYIPLHIILDGYRMKAEFKDGGLYLYRK